MAKLQSMMGISIQGMNMLTMLQSLPGADSNAIGPVSFSIGRRNLNETTAPFILMQSSIGVGPNGQLAQGQGLSTALVMAGDGVDVSLSGLTQLDGEYIVLVASAPGGGELGRAKLNSAKAKSSAERGNQVGRLVLSAALMSMMAALW
jgi:hypothetical protein